jgi:N-acetylneuraminic acid mutarotase
VGTNWAGTYMFQDFWEWDQATDVWTKKADFPGEKRRIAVGFSIRSKGYIAMGTDSSLTTFYNDLWEYNPDADTIGGSPWTQKASFPGAGRAAPFCFTIGTKAFIGTGTNFSVDFKDFKAWDQTTNTWTSKADFSGGGRHNAVGLSIGIKGYAGMGHPGPVTDFREYDPITDVWTLKAYYPGDGRAGLASFSIGNKGYIGLGCDPFVLSATPYTDFWEYNPLTTEVTDLNESLKIILYPNPTTNKFTIRTELLDWNFVIYNLAGESVYTSTTTTTTTEVDLSKEAKGIYFIKLQKENEVFTHKLIVQ